jgi:tight adherence protein B
MAAALVSLLALLMSLSLAAIWLGWRTRRLRRARLTLLLERAGIAERLSADPLRKRRGQRAAWLLGARGKRLLATTTALLLLDLLLLLGPLRPQGPLAVILLALPLAPAALEWRRQLLRRRAFAQQFPDALEAMVRGLNSGHTIDEALRMIASEFPAPLGEEFRQSNQHIQVGVPLGEALRELERRIALPELRYFILTLLVQRESGGQLAGILAELARILRRRTLFQGRLRALTAESRFTAWFVGGAPLAYLSYKLLFHRNELAFFLHDPTGQVLLRVSIVLIVCGALLLRWMMRRRF